MGFCTLRTRATLVILAAFGLPHAQTGVLLATDGKPGLCRKLRLLSPSTRNALQSTNILAVIPRFRSSVVILYGHSR